jgi:hypothetical protein
MMIGRVTWSVCLQEKNRNFIKSRKPYMSLLCQAAPVGRMSTEPDRFGDIADVINGEKFLVDRGSRFNFYEGSKIACSHRKATLFLA